MKPISAISDEKNLPIMYNAIVDYHNGLIQVRFTIAGLYLAATGFLVNSWFNIGYQISMYIIIPFLGISLAFVCWLLEMRTDQLMSNLAKRGLEIEEKMNVNLGIGFFELMNKQPDGPRNPFSKDKEVIPSSSFLSKGIVSHSRGFTILYLIIVIFWILAFFTLAF
jgi:hypothetical protein